MRTYEGLRFCWTCNQFQTCQDCRTFAYGCISCSEHKFEHNLAQCIRNFGDYKRKKPSVKMSLRDGKSS